MQKNAFSSLKAKLIQLLYSQDFWFELTVFPFPHQPLLEQLFAIKPAVIPGQANAVDKNPKLADQCQVAIEADLKAAHAESLIQIDRHIEADLEAAHAESLIQIDRHFVLRAFYLFALLAVLTLLLLTSCFSEPSFSELAPTYAFHYLKADTELKPLSSHPGLLQLVQDEKLYAKQEWDSDNQAVWEVKNQWSDRHTEEAMKAGLAWLANSGLSWEEKYREWLRRLPIDKENLLDNRAQDTPLQAFKLVNPQGKTVRIPPLYPSQLLLLLRASFASFYHLPFVIIAQRNTYPDSVSNLSDEDQLKASLVYFGHFGFRERYGYIADSTRFAAFQDYTAHYEKTELWQQDPLLRQQTFSFSEDVYSLMFTDFEKLKENQNINKISAGEPIKIGEFLDDFFCNKKAAHWMLYLLRYFRMEHIHDDYHSVQVTGNALKEGDIFMIKSDRLYGYWIKQLDGYQQKLSMRLSVSTDTGDLLLSNEDSIRLINADLDYLSNRIIESSDLYNPFSYFPYYLPTFLYGGGFKRMTFPIKQHGLWINGVQEQEIDFTLSSQNEDQLKERTTQVYALTQFEPVQGGRGNEDLDVILNQIRAKRQEILQEPTRCELRAQREQSFEALYQYLSAYGYSREMVDEEFRLFEDFVFQALTSSSKTCCWYYQPSTEQQEPWGEAILKIAKAMMADRESLDICFGTPIFMTEDGQYAEWEEKANTLNIVWPEWDSQSSCVNSSHIDHLIEQGSTPWCFLEDSLPAGRIWLQNELTDQSLCLDQGVKHYTIYVPVNPDDEYQREHINARVVLEAPSLSDALLDISVQHIALNEFVRSEQNEIVSQIEQELLNQEVQTLNTPQELTLNLRMLRGAFYDLRVEPRGIWRNFCQSFEIGFYH